MTLHSPTVPWAITLIAVLLFIGVVVSGWLQRRRSRTGSLPKHWPLSARPLFRPDERRAYRRLREALPQHVILSKLSLARFCQPDDPRSVRFWYELLGPLHVSFCFCTGSGRVLAVLDLLHQRGESRRSLQIKQAVLEACKIRYLRCSYDAMPSIAELQAFVPSLEDSSSKRFRVPPAERPVRAASRDDTHAELDSFFGIDSRNDADPTSEFAALRGLEPRKVASEAPGDIAGGGVDTPPKPPPPSSTQ